MEMVDAPKSPLQDHYGNINFPKNIYVTHHRVCRVGTWYGDRPELSFKPGLSLSGESSKLIDFYIYLRR